MQCFKKIVEKKTDIKDTNKVKYQQKSKHIGGDTNNFKNKTRKIIFTSS